MVSVNKGPGSKGGRYLMCDSVRRGISCSNTRRWRQDEAEAIVLSNVGRVDFGGVLEGDDPTTTLQATVEGIRQQLADAQKRRRRLMIAVEDMEEEDIGDDVRARIKDLSQQVRTSKAELTKAEAQLQAALAAPEDLSARIKVVETLRNKMGTLEGDDLYRLRASIAQELRRVLKELRFTSSNIVAFYAVPPSHKPNRFTLPDTAGHPLIPAAGDEMAGDAAEEYASSTYLRPRRRVVGHR